MKAALALLLCASPAIACDWKATRTVDPMTDTVMCMVSSASGRIAFSRYGNDPPHTVSRSIYSRVTINARVDDNPPIRIGSDGYSGPKGDAELMSQLKTGKRLRIEFDDYPNRVNGDTEVCNLIELLDSCVAP